jgi:ferric-dicitrate binding protein FerR (iron transport regulator)
LRQDSEAVLSGRAEEGLTQRYEGHLHQCKDCRRFHRVLAALYAGPGQPIGLSQNRQEQEFRAILQRVSAAQMPTPIPSTNSWLRWSAVGGFAVAALAFWLGARSSSVHEEAEMIQAVLTQSPVAVESGSAGGLGHRSQHFGRILAGGATLSPVASESTGDSFGVGTTLLVDHDDTLQVGLLGKMIASLDPSSLMEWVSAGPELVELRLEKGMLAIRYDRKPEDPILLIHTKDALVRVTGTVFTVEITAEGTTSVSVLRGKVAVHSPVDRRLLGEVDAGYRYDVASEVYEEVGAREVASALRLADESPSESDDESRLSLIPSTWRVPGLPAEGIMRSVDQINDPSPEKYRGRLASRASTGKKVRHRAAALSRRFEEEKLVHDLIESAVRSSAEAEDSLLSREINGARSRCRGLYDAPETRLLAAHCLQSFLDRYGTEPEARAEGLIAIGILRMDYARDFPASIHHFETFLRQFPTHSRAELVTYKLMLAHIESGDIPAAMRVARTYLRSFPVGAHVGRVLQRFPELKNAI